LISYINSKNLPSFLQKNIKQSKWKNSSAMPLPSFFCWDGMPKLLFFSHCPTCSYLQFLNLPLVSQLCFSYNSVHTGNYLPQLKLRGKSCCNFLSTIRYHLLKLPYKICHKLNHFRKDHKALISNFIATSLSSMVYLDCRHPKS